VTSEINQTMTEAAYRVIEASAALYGVTARPRVTGEAAGLHCDEDLRHGVREACALSPDIQEVVDLSVASGSEDATLLMEAVQARGGRATYLLIGSEMPAGHHQDRFDLEDRSMELGVELYVNILRTLWHPSAQ